VADAAWRDVQPAQFDVLLLPGGMEGSRRLAEDRGVQDAIRSFVSAGKTVGALCAAPLALQAAGVLAGRRATSHPSVRAQLGSARALDERVVTDGRIITSQSAGSAFEFALSVLELVDGPESARRVAPGLVLHPAVDRWARGG
jgi:putative intracellular protease/amidase